ncbi:hypothetical protein ARALYDRAFT_912671 [Arabidopsis lyrata subsp. lyrata]|uniref:DUF547 domain-containing protein n=1 Tax=Arabidopsis lyrata subsp. lyrata TaxID=81972 RepID=D7MB32_ARALL|nr:hypothetical protein ARALYDRAFT_912671 [Arabidopsis lyrata subsp. lyrata]
MIHSLWSSFLVMQIIELEERLQSQFDVRNDLENALGYRETFQDDNIFTPKSLISPKATLRSKCLDFSRRYDELPKHEDQGIEYRCFSFDNRFNDPDSTESDIGSSVRRCQSLLNQRSIFISNRLSPPEESIKEYIKNRSSIGIRISHHIPIMTPNKLSEEMIKYASTMYIKLADTPLLSSISKLWSPSFRKYSVFDDQFESSGPYSLMIKVSHIKRQGHDFELMLRHFRLLVKQLEDVDQSKLTDQEKLAFWINIHNSLVMHTFLVNGIPKNNGKRFLLLSKIIESFSKDLGLNQVALMEKIQECLPEPMRKTIKKLNMGRSRKSIIEWIPHNFGFRYLIAKELIK